MLKKVMVLIAIILLLILGCSKKNITNNYYPSPDKGRIVGFVYPPDSKAEIITQLGLDIKTTQIDSTGYFELTELLAGTYSLHVDAEGYYEYSKNLLVIGGLTVPLDTVFLISLHDLILDISPSHGAERVRLQETIRIVFRNQMDRASAETAFHIEPKMEGNFEWGSSGKNRPDFLYFVPAGMFATNTLYRVTIDSSASDKEGIKLSEPYQFSFTTEPLRIMDTRPRNQETWVSPTNYVSVAFNAYMNTESINSAFKMIDSHQVTVDGEFLWRDLRYLEFHPYPPLSSNEEYTISIDTTASDFKGGKLPKPYQFSFTTMPLRITYTNPTNHETWVDPSSYVYIYFSTAMDIESVILAFKMVDSDLNDVTGRFEWGNSQSMRFLSDSILAYDETYTVTIDTNAKDIAGGTLDKPYNFWFKTRPY